MPQKVVEEIRNPNAPESKGLLNSMNRIVDSFHGYLYNQPIGKLERSPVFKELYYNWVDKLADSMEKESIKKVMEGIRERAVAGQTKPERITGEQVWNKLLDLESGKRKHTGPSTQTN
jgi:ATP-dependent helicase/DNAse subunit B